jgi:hypothetical protein
LAAVVSETDCRTKFFIKLDEILIIFVLLL